MPGHLIEKLLEEDETLKEKLLFEEITFPQFGNNLDTILGLNILAGLQQIEKNGFLTLFRIMRFPTYKRLFDMLSVHGYAFSNFEQERILDLYQSKRYVEKRKEVTNDPLFWIQPQERVVNGLPLFHLVNDALQIHRAFRGEVDRVAIVVIHIPQELLVSKQISLIANAGIDLDYDNQERDVEISKFISEPDRLRVDHDALRFRGVDLYELYSPNLPWDIQDAKQLGIEQEFYLLDIFKVDTKDETMRSALTDTTLLKYHDYFLHGFFGDQNIFGRRPSEYLPSAIFSVKLK